MLSWEDYFRQNTLSETRALAKSLDREATTEGDALRKEIGGKHVDVLALTQRIGSLKLLVNRQESDLASFASAPNKHVPHEAARWESAGLGESHITNVVTARLLSIIDRSIVQRKYVLAARALYLARSFELPSEMMLEVTAKLERRLDAWLLKGTQVSQNMLHAYMILRRWSPATFVIEFLKARLSQIRKVLSDGNDMINAFKLIDSTLFIHYQLVSDLCKSWLSQRRITEMPEFSGQVLFLERLKAHPQAGTIRAFPPECYETSDEPVDNADFLRDVAHEVQLTALRLFNSIEDVNTLTSTLSKFVIQVQNSLSIKSGMGELLDACEPPFRSKFEKYLETGTRFMAEVSPRSIEDWTKSVTELRTEQAQIARLSRTASKVAPKFSEQLDELVSKSNERLNTNCKAAYTEERTRILEQPTETLEKTRIIVETIASLDAAYSLLGGSVAEAPTAQYEQLAKFIVERWSSQAKPDFHDINVSGTLFDLLLVMDSILINTTWTPALLEALRPLVLNQVRQVAPELLESTEQAFSDHRTQATKASDTSKSHARSRLLLRPLVL